MTTFNERELAFEAKFAHDEEFRFLATARRDKLFAHWVAERIGAVGEAVASMTAAALSVRDGPGHDGRMLEHMAGVVAAHGGGLDAAALAAGMADCAAVARQQLLEGPHVV